MNDLKRFFGHKVKDKITGFTGVVTGYCVYISGCNQLCIQPPVNDKNEYPDGKWFDEQRVEILGDKALQLINVANGFDAPPPVR